ncbi:MAG: hypothetical protein ABSA86_07300 [Oryzomonas sp.]|jgi:putative DNA primase/helicase
MTDPVAPTDQIQQYEEDCERLALEEIEFLGDTVPSPESAPEEPPDSTFIEQCLNNNERGDGILYARLLRDQFINVKKRGTRPWLIWRDHSWEIDLMGEHIRAVEKVATAYKDAAFELDEPIRSASAKQREAENRAKTAEIAGQAEEQAAAESEARGHAYQVKLLRSKKEKYIRRVDRLRGKAGAEKAVWWAHHIERPLAISGDEIDQHHMLLAAPNGVIDLVSGELRPGSPGDYLLRKSQVPYPTDLDPKRIMRYLDTGEDSPCVPWERFITEILSYDPDGRDDGAGVPQYLQRLAGYSITGDCRHHLLPITIGAGRNGKGTFFRICQAIAGDFYLTVKSELLLDQKNPPGPGSASPHLMALRGRRIVVASETDQHRNISAARVKEYSGGDTLNARGLFDSDEENIVATWLLWLQTNHIPNGVTKDFALRQRVNIINFPWRYVPEVPLEQRKEPHNAQWFRPMNPDLERSFNGMLPHILLWFIRGAILMQREGPNIPPQVRADLEDLQLKEDNIEQYLRACCLLDWNPDRVYGADDRVNCPDPDSPDKPGRMYVSLREGNKGIHPEHDHDQGAWRYDGIGIEPNGVMLFKEFYGNYKTWYMVNVTDKKDSAPSNKAVAADLRKKGYDVRTKGSDLKIFGGFVVLAYAT